MLLSDEEIKAALVLIDTGATRLPSGLREFARAIEAAILAKLASAELPALPEPSEMDGARWGYTADDMRNYAIGASAQGAASQLDRLEKAEKDAERLDWFNYQGYAYGFEDMQEGNRWTIDGPFDNVRIAIDTAMEASK